MLASKSGNSPRLPTELLLSWKSSLMLVQGGLFFCPFTMLLYKAFLGITAEEIFHYFIFTFFSECTNA